MGATGMSKWRSLLLGVAFAAVFAPAGARAQTPVNEADREYAFASWLVQNGFPDFAERLLDQLARRFPDQADRGRVIQAEVHIARRRFSDAEALVAAMPKDNPRAHAIRLAIANGYFRIGEREKARALYDAFFAQYKGAAPTDPDVRRFYMDAAYRLGQMLEVSGDLAGAAAAYEKALLAKPEEGIARRLMAEIAAVQVRAAAKENAGPKRDELLKKARKLCEEVQNGGIDIWFGQTIITLAHIELVQGKPDAAIKLLRGYDDINRQIEDLIKREDLPMGLSPVAGARYLLGETLFGQAEAKLKAGAKDEGIALLTEALREYFSVFARYADSDWAIPAGEKAEQVKARLEGLGKTVTVDFGPHLRNVIQAQLRLADTQFNQQRYEEAARQYLAVLNRYPNFEGVGRPLSNIVVAYAHLRDDWRMRAAAEHIAERYSKNDDAALGLLVAAKVYFDREAAEQYLYLYNLFVDRFPRHERTPAVLLSLAGMLRRAGNDAAADAQLERVIRDYPKDQNYPRALNQLAWSRYRARNYPEAIALFERLVKETPPSHERALAQFSLADALVRVNDFARAIREFRTLQSWLEPTKNNPYGTTAAEIAKNQELLRNATFYLGYALSRSAAEPAQLAAVRATALAILDQFVKKFADSDLAPKAMSIMGGIHLELGDSAKASEVFEELARRYPNSDEGRSAHYARISAGIELGRIETAREAWGEVRREPRRFTLDQIVRMGDLMRGAGLHAEAAEAYQIVRATIPPPDRVHLEPSLFGLGVASYEMKQYDKAVEALQELIQRYPRSALFYEAKFTLGRSLRELGRLAESVDALSEVFRYANDPILIATANSELAEVQLRLARRLAEENRAAESRDRLLSALASYQRIALSYNPQKPDAKLRPFVEEALAASVRLFTELGDFKRAVEDCDQYLTLFPDGARVADFRRWREDARLRAATAQP